MSYPSNETIAALSFLRQLQLQTEPRYEEDSDSTGFAASETLTFTQAPSICGDSILDVCTPPLSPYSQSSNPFSFSNRWTNFEYENCPSPLTAFEDVSISSQQPPTTVCYDHVQGRCTRSNCRYSHDLNTTIEKPVGKVGKRGICFDYLRGECTRGALCRFTHDIGSFAKDDNVSVDDDISLAKVKRWGQGICFDFVRGACTRGEKCPWSHNLLEIAVATKKGIENMETSERNRIAGIVRGRLRASGENNNSVHEASPTTTNTIATISTTMNLVSPRQPMTPPPLLLLSSVEAPPSQRSSQWVSLWNYPETVFGPLDEFGRPLHWHANASGHLMNQI